MPTLKHKEVVTSSVDRYRLTTETTGEVCTRRVQISRLDPRELRSTASAMASQVHIRLYVLTKDFAQYGVFS